jgi:hypothetical protein
MQDSNKLSLYCHKPSISFMHVDLGFLQSVRLFIRGKTIVKKKGKRDLCDGGQE